MANTKPDSSQIVFTVNGIGDCATITQSAANSSTKVASTAFVQGELTSQAVKLTGDQTVAGVKTFSSQPVLPQKLTQGTAIGMFGAGGAFTLPSWVKRVTLSIVGTSTNGTSTIQIRMQTGGVYQTSGYESCATTNGTVGESTAGFLVTQAVLAAQVLCGVFTFVQLTPNTWVMTGSCYHNPSVASFCSGSIVLGGTLEAIKFVTTNGTDTFDAGTVNVMYE